MPPARWSQAKLCLCNWPKAALWCCAVVRCGAVRVLCAASVCFSLYCRQPYVAAVCSFTCACFSSSSLCIPRDCTSSTQRFEANILRDTIELQQEHQARPAAGSSSSDVQRIMCRQAPGKQRHQHAPPFRSWQLQPGPGPQTTARTRVHPPQVPSLRAAMVPVSKQT